MDYIYAGMNKLVNAAHKKEEQHYAKGGAVKKKEGGKIGKAMGGAVMSRPETTYKKGGKVKSCSMDGWN